MFGFGIGKLILLVVVILGVWYGFKLFGRLEQNRKRQISERREQDSEETGKMEQCKICETYVLASSAANCGKEGCPY